LAPPLLPIALVRSYTRTIIRDYRLLEGRKRKQQVIEGPGTSRNPLFHAECCVGAACALTCSFALCQQGSPLSLQPLCTHVWVGTFSFSIWLRICYSITVNIWRSSCITAACCSCVTGDNNKLENTS
jgi:hypothetical protein